MWLYITLPLKFGYLSLDKTSLVPQECKQAVIPSQEGKQAFKSKLGAIKCCNEKKLLPCLMIDGTFHFFIQIYSKRMLFLFATNDKIIVFHFRSPSTHRMSPWARKIFIHVMPRILLMQRPNYMPRYSSEPPGPPTEKISLIDNGCGSTLWAFCFCFIVSTLWAFCFLFQHCKHCLPKQPDKLGRIGWPHWFHSWNKIF